MIEFVATSLIWTLTVEGVLLRNALSEKLALTRYEEWEAEHNGLYGKKSR